MHVILYLVLAVLATLAWQTELWVKGLVLVIIAVADECSKALRSSKIATVAWLRWD